MADEAWTSVETRLIEWSDMDAVRHVNNVKLLRYVEAGRANFFMSTAYIPPPLGFVLAEISYQIQIKHRVKNVGTTSMTLEYIVVSDRQGLCARGEARVVLFDHESGVKAPLPDEFKQRMVQLLVGAPAPLPARL